jgi:G:T/U-mismatch repair DNA glycosylase
LILGSFPSVLAVKNGFYYGNPVNRFYEVLGRLLHVDLKGSTLRVSDKAY